MRKNNASVIFLILAVALTLAAVVMWFVRSSELRELHAEPPPVAVGETAVTDGASALGDGDGVVDINPMDGSIAALTEDPGVLVAELVKTLQEDDMDGFAALLAGKMDAEAMEQLDAYVARQRALGHELRVREVGELELNQRNRWAIDFGAPGAGGSLLLDFKRQGDKWEVDKVTLPLGSTDSAVVQVDDALSVAGRFVQAVLGQRFDEARRDVDGGLVSDARIAGLCILFEEGHYQLRDQKPLRTMFQRDDVAGFIVNVVSVDGSAAGQFALTLVKQGNPAKWVVSEVNLDRLLVDYAERVAGGDIYFSPLVKSPKGGETLALYFGFDEDEVSGRTRKQLEIVAGILKADPVKKLTLSGHTDAKGTDVYNRELSLRRAEVVRDFLIAAGVEAGQVEVKAMGASEPRRPNVTETGKDNPDGRRANRRTEIYLDF